MMLEAAVSAALELVLEMMCGIVKLVAGHLLGIGRRGAG